MTKINVRDRNKGIPNKKPNWEYRFETASINGKRQCKSKSGFKTKKEAFEAGTKALAEYYNTGKTFEPSEISVADYFDYWLNMYVEPNLAEATLEAYSNIIKNHLKPAIGYYKLKTVDTMTLQTLINNIFQNNSFSRHFLKNVLKILRGAFKYAKKTAKFISTNPAEDVSLPSTEEDNEPIQLNLSLEDIEKILARFKNSPYQYYGLLISYYTGLRVSEVYGLTWDCVDFENMTLTVDKSCKKRFERDRPSCNPSNYRGKRGEPSDKWFLGATKTKSSKRIIRIGESLANELMEYKMLQEKNQREYGEFYIKHYLKEVKTKSQRTLYHIIPSTMLTEKNLPEANLVLVKENGEFHGPDSMRYPAVVCRKKLGIQNFHFRGLRHTHGTKLAESHAPLKGVQARLGHSKIETTMTYYIEKTKQMDDEIVQIFETTAKVNVNKTPRNERLHSIWRSMINRCNTVTSYYHKYGIQVCQEWKDDFSVFEQWSIEHNYSEDLSLLRIDKGGNFEPENCLWGKDNKCVKGENVYSDGTNLKSYSVRKIGHKYQYRIKNKDENGKSYEIEKSGFPTEESAILAAMERIEQLLKEKT